MKKILTILLTAILSIGAFNAKASSGEGEESGKIDTKAIIFEHLGDRYGWEVPFCHHLSIPLPIIVANQRLNVVSLEASISSIVSLTYNAK